MKKKYYKYRAYGLLIESEIEFKELLSPINNNDEPDVVIKYGIIDSDIKEILFQGVKTIISENNISFTIKDLGFFHIKNATEIIIEPNNNADINEIIAYLLGTCMGLSLYMKGVLAIHGSCIDFKDKAIVILGQSGAGKSTMTSAMIKKGYSLIADDISAISIDEEININSAYSAQRVCDDMMEWNKYNKEEYKKINMDNRIKYIIPEETNFRFGKYPLYSIFELCVDNVESSNIIEIEGSEKLQTLLNNIYGIQHMRSFGINKDIIKQCIYIAKNIPMYRITRPINGFTVDERIKFIEKIMYKDGSIIA